MPFEEPSPASYGPTLGGSFPVWLTEKHASDSSCDRLSRVFHKLGDQFLTADSLEQISGALKNMALHAQFDIMLSAISAKAWIDGNPNQDEYFADPDQMETDEDHVKRVEEHRASSAGFRKFISQCLDRGIMYTPRDLERQDAYVASLAGPQPKQISQQASYVRSDRSFLVHGWRILSVLQASVQTDARFFCTRAGGSSSCAGEIYEKVLGFFNKHYQTGDHLDSDDNTACYAMHVLGLAHFLFAAHCLLEKIKSLSVALLQGPSDPDGNVARNPDISGKPQIVYPSIQYTLEFFETSMIDLEAQADSMGSKKMFPAEWEDMWTHASERTPFHYTRNFFTAEIQAEKASLLLIRKANERYRRKQKKLYTRGRRPPKSKRSKRNATDETKETDLASPPRVIRIIPAKI